MAKPFLKWAGGKTQLLTEISKNIPFNKDDNFDYIEPFVGSGAVLFWMLEHYPNLKKVIINDINTDLTQCYQTIKDNVNQLIEVLHSFDVEYNTHLSDDEEGRKASYYEKRTLFNQRTSDSITQSALLIFLNRTCFNGLYRVNSKNEFNVPKGRYRKPQICNEENLRAVSKALQKVTILSGDFTQTEQYAHKNSFFYFDPPYKPLSESSNFNAYAQIEFNDEEQIRLKEFCDQINAKKSKWVLSNSDVKGANPNNLFFDELFERFNILRVKARRNINANGGKRGAINELLIRN